ncbi:iron-regulated protein [Leptolyngbya iicbica LK]|uniref:Iron-regulated protein n=3 Tax=Cyanophyceae TaxID=3028117 RepID=A0A4Q7EIK4_9CYAN|nr:iron-regulated protein [Leptolyngbya sp. LK]
MLVTSPLACSAEDGLTPPESPAAISSIQDETFKALQTADVVYLGERHDSLADHAAQLEIIEGLYAENPNLAIALEMFQRPFQPAIDRYLAGDITEEELIAQTEYLERWGFPWEFYAPVLRFAQAHDLPVLALNAPAEITRQVAREGLESLEGDDFRYIPPLEEIDTSNADYREFVAAAFGAHGAHGDFNLDNFFAAQVTWDETMAMTIADFKTANPDTQVVVLAGNGHVIYGHGIPDRVQRRLGDDLTQQIVVLNPIEFFEEEGGAIADAFWYSE